MSPVLTCVLAFVGVLLAFAVALALIYAAAWILACLAPLLGGAWVVFEIWNRPGMTAEEISILVLLAGSAAAVTTADCLSLLVGISHLKR